jgi:hypothetical protein
MHMFLGGLEAGNSDWMIMCYPSQPKHPSPLSFVSLSLLIIVINLRVGLKNQS